MQNPHGSGLSLSSSRVSDSNAIQAPVHSGDHRAQRGSCGFSDSNHGAGRSVAGRLDYQAEIEAQQRDQEEIHPERRRSAGLSAQLQYRAS